MRKINESQVSNFIKELHDALFFQMEDVDDICSYMTFKEGFPVHRTYSDTFSVNQHYHISFDCNEQILEIYNTKENAGNDWFNFYEIANYSKMELAIVIYQYLNK